MAIRVDDLRSLDPVEVRQETALAAELMQELVPTIDTRRGVLHDLLLHGSAVLATKNQVEQDRLRRSSSVNEILVDPTLADDDVVDNIASNYRVVREEGEAAGGAVTVVVDALRDITIAVGSIFEAQGKSFVTEQVFTGRTSSATVVTDNDRLLVSRGDGTYGFQISVAAEEVGEASQLVKDTVLVPRVVPIGFVTSYATEDFVGGLNVESNSDLVAKFAYGLTTRSMSDRTGMSAKLRGDFTTIVSDSLIGFGDPEMLRDRHSILPISLGGRADWYVQSQPLYRTYGATKEATLIEITGDGLGIWQLTFDRDEYPGLYTVRVQPATPEETVGEFPVTEVIRDYDVTEVDSNDGFVPEIANAAEAAFSRFQTVIVRFKDTLTSTSEMTVAQNKADYLVSVQAMPQIAEMQDLASQRGYRSVAGDVLVKAPLPVMVDFACSIALLPGQATPDTDTIADDLATLVNSYGFRGYIPASALLDIIHNHVADSAAITDVDLIGRLYYPDGTFRLLHDSQRLDVPYEPQRMSTSRTALFFLDPANVHITVTTADVLAVI